MVFNQNKQQPHEDKGRLYYGYIVIIVSFILMLSFGIFFSFGVFFKPLQFEFGLDRVTTSSIVSLCTVIIGLSGIVAGRVNDKLGPRVVLTFSSLLTSISYMLMSKVGDVWQIYLVYGLMLGIGLGGMMVPLMSTIARWFGKKRSMMTGIVLNGIGMGQFIIPPVATRLIAIYDWRIAYLIMGGIALVINMIAAQFLKRGPNAIRQPNISDDNNFEHVMESGTDGVYLKDALRTRQFWLVLTLFFLLGFCRFTVLVHIVPHAIGIGMLAIIAANLLATIGGMSIFTRPLIGVIADRIGNRKAFILGFIVALLAFLLLVPAEMEWMLYLAAIAFSFNWGLTSSESPLVAGLFGLKAHGLIFGIIGFGYTIGAALGPLLAGYIYDTTNSYVSAFWICAAFSIIGITMSSLLTPIGDSSPLRKAI